MNTKINLIVHNTGSQDAKTLTVSISQLTKHFDTNISRLFIACSVTQQTLMLASKSLAGSLLKRTIWPSSLFWKARLLHNFYSVSAKNHLSHMTKSSSCYGYSYM